MNNKLNFILFFLLTITIKSFSQTVINTESNLNKIDSTFHLFIDGMGDYKKGNLDFFMIKTNLTIGSRFKEKNLLRFTFSNNYQKFNGNPFKNSISGQIRYNFFYNLEKHHSIFLFSQLGKSQRSMIDRRFLLGGGIRQRITPSKNSGYIDIAYGGFYENEEYPKYNINQNEIPSEVYNNLRLTLNIFTRLKLNEHWNLVTVMYSQWKSNRMKNYRIFLDSTLNYIISKKATIFLKFNGRFQSEPYIPFISNETDTLLGFRVSI
tara:strand:- start:777 stop:1568 length:792 start_codon:yes stop_codon:yes gene_type:complete